MIIALTIIISVICLGAVPGLVAWYRGIETGTQGWWRRAS